MKTYLFDLIPKLQRFSQKLDFLTKLTNQHWVVVDEIESTKNVYIFRTNNELLISKNGNVERAKWEYLGNNYLLIDIKNESYLFKNGFFDDNILALKLDNKNEYALLVNETRYEGELNTVGKIANFLTEKYLAPPTRKTIKDTIEAPVEIPAIDYKTNYLDTLKGKLEIKTRLSVGYTYGDSVYLNGVLAPDGKYVYGWPAWASYVVVKDGKLEGI